MIKQKNYESGLSMTVVIIVLAIIGAVAGVLFWGRSVTQRQQKINLAKADIEEIVFDVRALTVKNKDFSRFIHVNTIEMGKEFLSKIRSTSTPFGGNSYYSVVFHPEYPDILSVYIVNIDDSYCRQLNENSFKGAVGSGCGETWANIMFNASQQKFGVGVAINTNEGLNRVEDRFGIFYKKS